MAIASVLAALVVGGIGVYWWLALRTPTHRLPDVVGDSVADARRRMASLSFAVETRFVRKDGTQPDEVVEQRPAPGVELAEGRRVVLVVSRGNTTVPFPLIDSSMDEATVVAAIERAGLVVGDVTRPYDEVIPAGFVVSATAELLAGGDLPRQSPVTLVVSAGPAPRTLPPGLAGQSWAAVKLALDNVQLVAVERREHSEEVPVDVVMSLNQVEGTPLPRGTQVEVVVSKGPAPVPVPDVTGRTGAEADQILRDAGFTVEIAGLTSGAVLASDPPAGTPVARGSTVRLLTRS